MDLQPETIGQHGLQHFHHFAVAGRRASARLDDETVVINPGRAASGHLVRLEVVGELDELP